MYCCPVRAGMRVLLGRPRTADAETRRNPAKVNREIRAMTGRGALNFSVGDNLCSRVF